MTCYDRHDRWGSMVHARASTEIGSIPELARLAHEVAAAGEPCSLTENGEELAVITRARPRRRRRGLPFTTDDPLWEIVGSIDRDIGSDLSSNKHKYLDEIHTS